MIDRFPSAIAMEGSDPQPEKWSITNLGETNEEIRKYPGEGREIIEKQYQNKYK